MESMIDRVAQAILKQQKNNRSAFPDNRDLARAAIEAMREPTEEMEDWFLVNLEYTETGVWIWKGAIDAALKENEEKTA